MQQIIDKRQFWLDILDDLSSELDTGTFFLLREGTYLDKLEAGQATVAVSSETLLRLCEQKYARTISKALSMVMKRHIKITFAHGAARIYEKPRNDSLSRDINQPDHEELELEKLHEYYGDIMGIVDNHPRFRHAWLPLTQGGWGIFPEILTNACKDYGVLNILRGLEDVGSRPTINNARGYFLDKLIRGEYGGKLATGAKILGRLDRL